MDTSIVQILCRVSSLSGGLKIGETSDGFLAALERRGLEKFFVQALAPTGPEAQVPQTQIPQPLAKAARQGHA
jgi:hypothetical protein